MEYVKDAQNTVNHFYEKEEDFIDSIQQSLKDCLTPASSNVSPDMFEKKKLYKYQHYDMEKETGKLDAHEVDRSDINITFNLSNLSSIIRDDHLNYYFNDDEKFRRSICRYINEPTALAIIDRAYSEAKVSYEDNMKCPATPLLKNQKRAAALRKKLNKKLSMNPHLLEEQEEISPGKFNTTPKRTDSFKKDDVTRKIQEINRDLKLIKGTNEELQKQISLIEKAKASLDLEKGSIDVAVQFETKRLAEAKAKLNELQSASANQK